MTGFSVDWEESPGDGFERAEGPDETRYAQGRRPDRTYASRSFPIDQAASRDFGQPARFVHKVVDCEQEYSATYDGSEWVIKETPGGRYQFKLLVAREAGAVKHLFVQRVPAVNAAGGVKVLLSLGRDDARRLIELLKNLETIPVEGANTARVDDSLLKDFLESPEAMRAAYAADPQRVRLAVENDANASDVIALAYRRSQIEHFKRLLADRDYFQAQCAITPGVGQEAVWQRFFEKNPWIFGVALAGQLLTAWNTDRLEQVVSGFSISGPGKRADGVMRTAGIIRSLVLVEVKTHETPLLKNAEYRSGCWAPSDELAGGVAQAQGTAHAAVNSIGDRLADRAPDGSEVPGQATYLVRPRSFLVVGTLGQLTGQAGGVHADKFKSFELYRRHLVEPEVVTFDELLKRAEWHLEVAEAESSWDTGNSM